MLTGNYSNPNDKDGESQNQRYSLVPYIHGNYVLQCYGNILEFLTHF